jgi:hypothetical protein
MLEYANLSDGLSTQLCNDAIMYSVTRFASLKILQHWRG